MNNKDLADFANADNPLRCSGIGELLPCTWRAAIEYLAIDERGDNYAAQVGSATHSAIAEWHRSSGDEKRAISVMMKDIKEKYTLIEKGAGAEEALEMFLRYSRDPRNIGIDTPIIEEKSSFSIPAHKKDPTGQPIVIQGTLDQLRYDSRKKAYYVYDIKTIKLGGGDLICNHSLQIHLYTFTALATMARKGIKDAPIFPGSIVRTRSYLTRKNEKEVSPSDVFWPIPSSFKAGYYILASIQEYVRRVRSGELDASPNEGCKYCPSGGFDFCTKRAEKFLELDVITIS